MATKAKKNPKSGDDILLETIQQLLEQKETIDKQLLRAQKKLVRRIARQKASRARKAYVKRMNNKSTLKKAIRQALVPNQPMTMKDILAALSTSGAYKTRSSYFYTMVNNKLNRDPRVKKVNRGVFMFVPRSKPKPRPKTTRKYTSTAA
jgi:hydroxylamine reductase (hybrid-cluster protein)